MHCCAVCRTDLHVIEGDLPQEKMPIIPGHQIVGTVDKLGAGDAGRGTEGNRRLQIGQRVGVAWLRHTCGQCGFCTRGQENLCESARFTGYHADGGYAEYAVAPEDFVYRLPKNNPPLPLGEGRGEGDADSCHQQALTLTLSQRERGLTAFSDVEARRSPKGRGDSRLSATSRPRRSPKGRGDSRLSATSRLRRSPKRRGDSRLSATSRPAPLSQRERGLTAFSDVEAAPLLCSGIIGYRALRRCNLRPGGTLALYGFGSSAHVVIQIARHRGCQVYVVTRGENHRELARQMGAVWVGEDARRDAGQGR